MASLGLVTWGTAATATAAATTTSITAAGWGLIGAAVSAGASSYQSSQVDTGGDNRVEAPQMTDKTDKQKAEKLDAIEIGDEKSRKRKKQSAKTKFKTDLAKPEKTTGVTIGEAGKVQGVQI